MKRNNELSLKAIAFASVFAILQGCTHPKTEDNSCQVETLTCDTTVSLKEGIESSPTCKLKYSMDFLTTSNPSDSIVTLTNSALMKAIEEGMPSVQTPDEFVRHIKDTLITNYRQDLGELYEYDLRNELKDHELPGWYNYEYEIKATLSEGKEHIRNYKVYRFAYTGGAHPNSVQKWINITDEGKVLTKEEVFLPNTEAAVCELILKELIRTAGERVETDTITSIEGLREYGILQMNGLYLPDNFLMEKEGIRFLYNPYDIAPYALGNFELFVPYQELNTYLIKH